MSAIAAALEKLSEAKFKELYFAIDPDQYGFPLSQEDFLHSWEHLKELAPFFRNAATNQRAVIFTASQ